MPDQEDIATWVTRPLKTGELIFVKGIRANDLPDDDNCAICHAPYGTPNEDVGPEHAVRFACGHAVGNTCFQMWLDSVRPGWLDDVSPEPRCMFCNKSVVPAQFLLEQVEEIWSTVSAMSPEAWTSYTPGGPLSQAIRTLDRYIDEADLSQLETPDKCLATNCEGLLAAARSFGHALMEYMQLDNALANRHDKHLRDLGNAKRVFENSCYRYQRVSEAMVVKWANKLEGDGAQSVKSLRPKTWRFTTAISLDILLLFLFTTMILWILYLGIEGVGTVFPGHRPTSYLLGRIHVGVGSFTENMLIFLLTAMILLALYLGIEDVGTELTGHLPTPYLLRRIQLKVDHFTDILLVFVPMSVGLLPLYLPLEVVRTMLVGHRPTPYLLGPVPVEVGSFTDNLFGSLLTSVLLLVLYSYLASVGIMLMRFARHRPTYLLGVRLLEVIRYWPVRERYERFERFLLGL